MAQRDVLALPITTAGAINRASFVTLGGAQCGYGEPALGVADAAALTGDSLSIYTLGTCTVKAGAAIPAGSQVQSDASGYAIPLTNGEPLGRLFPGASASAAGQEVEVIIETRPMANTVTIVATEDLTLNRFVAEDGAMADAGDNAYGVLLASVLDTETGRVQISGIATVEAGAAIAAGALVEADADGKAITRTSGAILGRLAPGESAAADGDLVKVILIPN